MSTARAVRMASRPIIRHPRAHGVVWHRPTPAAWVERLHQIVPPEGASWLMLRWEPGEPWFPIERWTFWQVRPRWVVALTQPDALAELDGPNPRRQGHACFDGWCQCPVKKQAWNPMGGHRNLFVDYQQWRLYHETGGADGGLYGTRYHVVQGHDGGNRWALSPFEAKLDRLKGGTGTVPKPGYLPYADVDERVWAKIADADSTRRSMAAMTDLKGIQRQMERMEQAEKALLEDAAGVSFDREQAAMAEHTTEAVTLWNALTGHERGPVMTKEEKIAGQAALDADRVKAAYVQGVINDTF